MSESSHKPLNNKILQKLLKSIKQEQASLVSSVSDLIDTNKETQPKTYTTNCAIANFVL